MSWPKFTTSQWKKGCIPFMKGKKHSIETINKIRMAKLGKKLSEKTKEKISETHKKLGIKPPSPKGKHLSEETKERMRKYWKGRKRPDLAGENNPRWRGGISFEPYPPTFNQQLKDRIRVRDNFICQLCKTPELECNKRLTVHHIDYNKNNCKEYNLISLCHKCNSKVNNNRNYWENYFILILKEDVCIK